MVSFTTPEGGPQTLERMVTKLDELRPIMSMGMNMNVSMERSDVGGSFTSTSTVGTKRGPPSPGRPGEREALKRIKVQQTTDAQLASMVFKKFVNNALDERAVVGLTPPSVWLLANMGLVVVVGESSCVPGAAEEVYRSPIG